MKAFIAMSFFLLLVAVPFRVSADTTPNDEVTVTSDTINATVNVTAEEELAAAPVRNECEARGYVCRPVSPHYSCSAIGGRPLPYRCGGLGASCCDR